MTLTQPSSRRVGVIGLGAMGAGIAQSLRRAGHDVHVYDIRADAAAAFAAQGGVACATLADMAAACDIVISVVVNAQQTEAVLYGEGGIAAALRAGAVFVMCSTVDPSWSIAQEARLAEQGVLYLDAPISGGAAKAAAGQMTMMTAGRAAADAGGGAGRALPAGPFVRCRGTVAGRRGRRGRPGHGGGVAAEHGQRRAGYDAFPGRRRRHDAGRPRLPAAGRCRSVCVDRRRRSVAGGRIAIQAEPARAGQCHAGNHRCR
ncbi:hypothetical protein G6F31_013493 [Rhizopus arrhizus]|nr:hypothetical protein G6F31_013493 [Rhizopus arrhizus]